MVSFNSFATGLCAAWSLVAALLFTVELRSGGPSLARNVDFRNFQRSFLAGYLPCLFADSLQAPFLYYLYQSYGFVEGQIAILYIFGLVSSLACSLFGPTLHDRVGPRLLCLVMVGLGSMGCLLKLFPLYTLLLLSRILDGAASWLLSTAPQMWYFHQHVRQLELPPSWLARTSRMAAIFGGWLAIAAGALAEFSEDVFGLTPFPFVAAVPALLLGGLVILRVWKEATPVSVGQPLELRPKMATQFRRALKAVAGQPPIALLAAVQAMFESVLYMFVFLWTPLFMYLRPALGARPFLGLIYAGFMASALCGALLYKILCRKITAWHLLPLSVALSFVSMCIAVMLMYPHESSGGTFDIQPMKFNVLLATLCMYEVGVGLYFPIVERLQRELLARDDRPAILGIFRIPLILIACGGLLVLHDKDSVWGNWLLLTLSMVLLAVTLLTALLLQAIGPPAIPPSNLPTLLAQSSTPLVDDDSD